MQYSCNTAAIQLKYSWNTADIQLEYRWNAAALQLQYSYNILFKNKTLDGANIEVWLMTLNQPSS